MSFMTLKSTFVTIKGTGANNGVALHDGKRMKQILFRKDPSTCQTKSFY